MRHLQPDSTEKAIVSIVKDVEIGGVVALPFVWIPTYAMCKYLCVFKRLTLIYVTVLRSQDLFPWKQGAEGEMATPPKWEKRLVLSLVSQVSPQIAFQNIYSPT